MKKNTKFKKIIIIVLAIVLVAGIAAIKPVTDIIKADRNTKIFLSYRPECHDISLSKEQMLEDFEYLFNIAVTNAYTKKYAEQYYKVDYDEIYVTYKKKVEECKDEYEFVALMIDLDCRLPGSHSYVRPPMNENMFSLDFLPSKNLNKEMVEVNYSLSKKIEERMKEYNQKFAIAYYYDGDYMFSDPEAVGFERIEGLDYARIVSLNGESVKDVIKNMDTFLHWRYDADNDSVFVESIIFNDGVGDKYDAEIELPDGTIIHKELYASAEYNVAYVYRNSLYPDKSEDDDTNNAETKNDKETENETVKKSYTIETDKDRRLVYANIRECNVSEKASVKEDLTSALEEADAEYVIIDLRYNRGGECDLILEGVLPPILNKDAGHINYTLHPNEKFARDYYGNVLYSIWRGFRKSEGKIRARENFKVKGEAQKEYKVFVLTDHKTFSSGDICAYVAKQAGATLIGQNTGGEGISGNPLINYMPNSKLIFGYVDGISEVYPEDNYLGTTPHYYVKTDWDAMMNAMDLFPDMDADVYRTYQNRLKWDPCIIKAIELIEE